MYKGLSSDFVDELVGNYHLDFHSLATKNTLKLGSLRYYSAGSSSLNVYLECFACPVALKMICP